MIIYVLFFIFACLFLFIFIYELPLHNKIKRLEKKDKKFKDSLFSFKNENTSDFVKKSLNKLFKTSDIQECYENESNLDFVELKKLNNKLFGRKRIDISNLSELDYSMINSYLEETKGRTINYLLNKKDKNKDLFLKIENIIEKVEKVQKLDDIYFSQEKIIFQRFISKYLPTLLNEYEKLKESEKEKALEDIHQVIDEIDSKLEHLLDSIYEQKQIEFKKQMNLTQSMFRIKTH